ncbi:Cutinase transcription factor 1 beta [Fulvia fulva]|uniref:Cutinase transcription factor 1 beta n=1 Tax=Passalora fulva TaxID=5499 RepID=A0A9Q8P572_PASFU|nr:Cutinase transcription factor 1 beta [Fulvia fulva]KAK4631294.1 Cutinase transcription factor 1 beta [Fulvia fulva]KAK4632709.1 Cutinase transcription factor 1 beta [Fulvia fulva]UJO13591.1 Cutinase transcription factor 1 beta [Fulvia fulva]WPV11881.1 Cutinase transcription factor 1 beta [Fulvia fulva]WPV25644.1 Cutinase transcription factor 1 beta [Fulvia fulva]
MTAIAVNGSEPQAMHTDDTILLSPGANARGKLKQRRSRKACQHCHTRKIRCNVLENGTPCSNCVDAGTTCIIRRRKNQRRESTPPDQNGHHAVIDQSHSWRLPTPSGWPDNTAQRPSLPPRAPSQSSAPYTAQNGTSIENGSQSSASPDTGQLWTVDTGAGLAWDQNALVDASSASCDFSHLTDLDDIFTFTGNTLLPPIPQQHDYAAWHQPLTQQNLSPPPILPSPGVNVVNGAGNVGPRRASFVPTSVHIPGLNPRDHEYLRGEGCFDLPPATVLRQMMHMYFRMNHPNLPIVAEDQFWALWSGDEYRVGEYSYLLLRAMIFAATSYTEPEVLSTIGFVSKREARNTHYRQAKLLFDFGIERDPVCSAQACLLLSYNAPNYNIMRLNTYWVTNAMRFARIARADFYDKIRDPVRSKLLKRLWWGVIFRDRILSMGLRRSLQVELEPAWAEGDKHVITALDFQNELGKSPVHDTETQLRVVEVVGATCRLMQCLTNAGLILYRYEHLDDRLDNVGKSIPQTIQDIKRCLETLRHWHDHAIRLFPFPVSLDDAPETICVYANMMFSYHAAAVFGLNTYLILIREVFSQAKALFSLEEAHEALQVANTDVSRRTQELVQVRLVKYLPISASAVLALPLILQAINVSAARGSGMEAVERRRLDVFTRTLKSQQQSFDGSDFCADALANIVAYAQDDSKFVSSMTTWRDGKDTHGGNAANGNGAHKVRLDWGNLVYKRPRLFLRLVLYLDHAFSTGGPPGDDDFPEVLQKSAV